MDYPGTEHRIKAMGPGERICSSSDGDYMNIEQPLLSCAEPTPELDRVTNGLKIVNPSSNSYTERQTSTTNIHKYTPLPTTTDQGRVFYWLTHT